MANRTTIISAAILGIGVASGLSYQLMKEEKGKFLNQVAMSENGVMVKFSGGSITGQEIETIFGPSILSNAIPPEGYCHLVIEATVKMIGGKEYPNLAYLDRLMMNGAAFIKVPESGEKKIFYWSGLFRGNDCLMIADSGYFVGSDMVQLLLHEKKDRFLRVKSKKQKKEDPDQVPLGNALADPDSEIIFPVEWSGRGDLNFVKADKDQKPMKRGEQ